MSTALKIISFIVFTLIVGGLFTRELDNFMRHAFPAGMLAFAFIWVPFVLFYRYDLKNHNRHKYLEKLKKRGIEVNEDTGHWWNLLDDMGKSKSKEENQDKD